MRTAARTDDNQRDLVASLRRAGCSVLILSSEEEALRAVGLR